MYCIDIDDIPSEGLQLDYYASQEQWLREAMAAAFGDRVLPEDEAHISLTLVRSDDHVSMLGGGYIHLHPTCDRCLAVYATQQQIPIHIIYAPHQSRRHWQEPEGAQSGARAEDDVDFSYYHGRQIDIAGTLIEQLVLAQPMQYLCMTNCQGLCPTCGKNLNRGPCQCPRNETVSPFEALKELKLPRRRHRRS